MTRTSRKWRDKRNKRIRVYIKIHNIVLSVITGLMFVFFLLPLCANELNKDVLLMFALATIWLTLFIYANELDCVKEGD